MQKGFQFGVPYAAIKAFSAAACLFRILTFARVIRARSREVRHRRRISFGPPLPQDSSFKKAEQNVWPRFDLRKVTLFARNRAALEHMPA